MERGGCAYPGEFPPVFARQVSTPYARCEGKRAAIHCEMSAGNQWAAMMRHFATRNYLHPGSRQESLGPARRRQRSERTRREPWPYITPFCHLNGL